MPRMSASRVAGAILIASSAYVSNAFADAAVTDLDSHTGALDEIVIIARHLNEARNGIQTQTGASTYTINEAAISTAPGGDNQLLNAPDLLAHSGHRGAAGRVRSAHRGHH
jgi:hypothetical protein